MRYPILAKTKLTGSRQAREEILEIRHSSLYCPRDFDISPYFNVVKPTIARGFDYKRLQWADLSRAPQAAEIPLAPEVVGADGDIEVVADPLILAI